MYSPLIGQFAQRDPLGYAAGDANVLRYCANNPVIVVDPTGLWTRIGTSSLYQHQPTKNDTFDGLAKEILEKRLHKSIKIGEGKNYNPKAYDSDKYKGALFPDLTTSLKKRDPKYKHLADKVFETEMQRAWDRQQPLDCGVYDVSGVIAQANGTLKNGPAVKLAIGTEPEPAKGQSIVFFNLMAKTFFNLEWAATTDAIREKLKTASKRGQTPIKEFWLAGHSIGTSIERDKEDPNTPFAEFTLGSLVGKKGREEAGRDLGFLDTNDIWWQSYEDAKTKKSYPPGFWFSGDATIVFIGCWTDKLAEVFAKGALRENAHAVGTTDMLKLMTTGNTNSTFEAYFSTTDKKRYNDYRTFMQSPGWVQFDSQGNKTEWKLP